MFTFREIETERLILREITDLDVDDVFEMRSDAEVMRFIPRPLAKTNEDALKHIRMIRQNILKKDSINWGIALKTDRKMIGFVGYVRIQAENYRAEIGYLLNKKYHKQGYMHELMHDLLKFGFEEMSLHSIEAVIDPENIASENVLIKNGFTKEAHFKENCYYDGRFLDSVHYSLLKENFHQAKQ